MTMMMMVVLAGLQCCQPGNARQAGPAAQPAAWHPSSSSSSMRRLSGLLVGSKQAQQMLHGKLPPLLLQQQCAGQAALAAVLCGAPLPAAAVGVCLNHPHRLLMLPQQRHPSAPRTAAHWREGSSSSWQLPLMTAAR
jgi:hypothetical protein